VAIIATAVHHYTREDFSAIPAEPKVANSSLSGRWTSLNGGCRLPIPPGMHDFSHDRERIAPMNSLRWTAAPLLRHTGITSHPGTAAVFVKLKFVAPAVQRRRKSPDLVVIPKI